MTYQRVAKYAVLLAIAAVTLSVQPQSGWAQDRGDRGRDRGRGRGDDERDLDRRERFLKELDRNNNGVLDEGEVSGRASDWVRRIARDAGESFEGSIRLSRLMPDRFNSAPGSMSFGTDEVQAAAPGFEGEESSSSNQSVYLPATARELEDAKETAEDLFDRYDRNRSRILEREEWTRISGTPSNADTNRDGKISRTELVNRLVVMRHARGKSESSEAPADRRDGRTSGGDSRRATSGNSSSNARSYRFTTALERIPEAARAWITEHDKNGDGQVSMHEYSDRWTDSRVRDFIRYDGDNDGVVTPVEYLANK